MILERVTHPQFVSNTYLLADGHGGPAFFIDAGGPVEPLIAAAERHGLEPSHVLLTHHHFDHVSEVPKLRERWPELVVLINPVEREALGEIAAEPLAPGEMLRFGSLEVRPLHTPGHTAGMLSFLVSDTGDPGEAGGPSSPAPASRSAAPGGFAGADGLVFTGDTLFAGSVGGVRAPGHTTYMDLRDSIMGTLMELPPETVIHPGHAASTTVAEEWEANPFVRVWRGLDPEGAEPCIALGEPATLVLLCGDYDGGTKAWVRWP
ncbi:MAG TPA: MBL fold metallo-hydrolase, partial [Solirubrobacteraceae bacterium]|nr:MBL fold metallo-hydrolase [Solirubrobacteraceae bacterium]